MKIEDIHTSWIQEQIKELGVKRKDLTKDLLLDRSYLSHLFSSDDKPHSCELLSIFTIFVIVRNL